jgi:tRNA dimethylallyltransferase
MATKKQNTHRMNKKLSVDILKIRLYYFLNMSNNKILVIVGQTTVGKSDLAVYLAKKFNGEVISADSRQVYKGLNIATGKITKKEMRGVKHHLLDICSPKKVFNVSDFKKLAEKSIDDILERNKLPIICGGTGFYIDAVVKNQILPEVKPNLKLRQRLEKLTTKKLFATLLKLDKARARNIDKNNRVRLIRAIEIAKTIGKVPKIKQENNKYQFLQIGIKIDKEILKKKIEKRTILRIKKGMINEARKLHQNGLSFKRMRELGLEYRFLADFLQNTKQTKEDKQKLILDIEKADLDYAKRQLTWFKRDKNIKWFEVDEVLNIEKEVKGFLD